jgi:hypothetical protein
MRVGAVTSYPLGGSQNASRIQGEYAYPVRTYDTSAIQEVEPMRRRERDRVSTSSEPSDIYAPRQKKAQDYLVGARLDVMA